MTDIKMSELSKRLRIKAAMINAGERIEWGSETSLMDLAALHIEKLEEENERLRAVLTNIIYDQLKQNPFYNQEGSQINSAMQEAIIRVRAIAEG